MFERNSGYVRDAVPLVSSGGDITRMVGLRSIFQILRRQFWIILAFVLAAAGLAATYLAFATPIYFATATILVESRRQSVINPEQPVQTFGNETATIESQVQVLRSEAIVRRVIQKLDLVNDEEFRPTRKRKLYVMRDAVARSIANWTSPELVPPFLLPSESELKGDSPEEALTKTVEAVNNRLSVSRIGTTLVIAVTFGSRSPEKAARLANAVSDAYFLDQYEVRYDATRRTISWLNERLAELRQTTEDSERITELYRAENNLVTSSGRLVNEQQLTEINNQLVMSRARVAETKAKLDQAASILASGSDPGAVPEALQSEVIARLKTQYGEISRKLADLTQRYGPRHPSVLNASNEARDTVDLISEELRRIAQSYRNDYEVARSRELSLSRSLAELEEKSALNNQAQIRLRELERDATSNRTLYQTMLNRFKEISTQGSLPNSESRVLGVASVPRTPGEPRQPMIMSLSIFLGLCLGIATAFGLEHMNSGLRTRAQVEEALGLQLISQLPMVRGRRGVKMGRTVVDHPMSAYAEGIRAIRMAASFANSTAPVKVIAIASALPGEGKSTTAANFANYAAAAGLKTLLIDADLRRPTVTKMFDTKATIGLPQYLRGEVPLDGVIVFNKDGLSVIPTLSDPTLTNTAELVGSKQMAKLISETRNIYDLVVIDVAPILPVINSRLLLEFVDKLVLVVEWDKTARQTVAEALHAIRVWQPKILGVVLNKVNRKRAGHDDHYSSKYYTRRYPHYYGRDAA